MPQLNDLNPILHQVFKLLVVQFQDDDTDVIVDAEGFVEACKRTLSPPKALTRAMRSAALSIGFVEEKTKKWTSLRSHFVDPNGAQEVHMAKLRRGLQSRLIKFVDNPDCECLMMTMLSSLDRFSHA
jgi:translation initiation factor 2 gamma subunit (eIF-2gamma)